MYVPASFVPPDQDTLLDFIKDNGFGTLMRGDTLQAVHLPFLVERTSPIRLMGHLARANPLWHGIDGENVLVVFQGPHTYVSPRWYGVSNAVPTWNYVAVHVSGSIRLMKEDTEVLEMLTRTVGQHEARAGTGWSLDEADAPYIDRMVGAIVGFVVEVRAIEGSWKLNQNHPVSRRTKVMKALREAGGDQQLQIADLMEAAILPAGGDTNTASD